jgi:predicted dehydrogenase
MKMLVVGCGSIGRRHIKNILSLGHGAVGVDLNAEYRGWVEQNLGIKAYGGVKEAIDAERPHACLVCTPPSTHITIANLAIENGLHAFIEKPLSNSLDGIEKLIEKAKKKNLKIAVGYNLRFNKGVRKVRELLDSGAIGKPLHARIIVAQYLPDWRPWQDYRKSYSSSRKMGGGVLLDCSHELDYARWLLGEPEYVTCVAKKVSDLEVDTEDTADIILEMKSGAVANIHMDFVRLGYKRGCEIAGEKGNIEFIFGEKVELFSGETKETKLFDVKGDLNETYVEELKHFIYCIERGKAPLVDAEEGKRTLQLALKAKEAAEKRKAVKI